MKTKKLLKNVWLVLKKGWENGIIPLVAGGIILNVAAAFSIRDKNMTPLISISFAISLVLLVTAVIRIDNNANL